MSKSEQMARGVAESKIPFPLTAGEIPTSWLQPTQRFASAMASVSAEMMKFATRRLEAQAKAWEDCSNCTDLVSLTQMQGRFLREMTEEYSDAAAEMIRRAQEIMANGGSAQAK
jgi:hypothetical protein